MSLSLYITHDAERLYPVDDSAHLGITHNLTTMADQAGIYKALWRPDELFADPRARDIEPLLRAAIPDLIARQEHYEQWNPKNGWGSFETLIRFVRTVHSLCVAYPDAYVYACR